MATAILGLAALLAAAQSRPAQPKPVSPFDRLARQAAEARDAKRLDEAVALYKQALLIHPNWDEGWWNLGSIAYDRDNYPECVLSSTRLVNLKHDLTPGWTMLGLCEYRLRRYDNALKSLLQVERLGFKEEMELSRAARLHLALLLNRSGAFERSLAILTELIRIGGKTPQVAAAAGVAGLRRPWLPADVPASDRQMVLELGDAMVSAMEQDQANALEKFETAVRDFPNEPNLHYRFGAFLMLQTPDRGMEEIKKALDQDPRHVPALVGLTMIYIKRGDLAAAREYGERAVKTAPGEFSTHVALGRVLLLLNDAAGAAGELETAVKLAPDNPEARFALSSAYSRLGRKADAGRQLEEFHRLRKLIDSSQP